MAVGRVPLSDDDVVEGRDCCGDDVVVDGNVVGLLRSKMDLQALQRVLGVRD